MEVEEFFDEWEEDDWAELIEEAEEDGEIAVQSEEVQQTLHFDWLTR